MQNVVMFMALEELRWSQLVTVDAAVSPLLRFPVELTNSICSYVEASR